MQGEARYLVREPVETAVPVEVVSGGMPLEMLVPIVVASVFAAVVVVLVGRLVWDRVRPREAVELRFLRASRLFGLGGAERRLLRVMAAGVGVEPSVLLVSESVYRTAAAAYVESTNRSLPVRESGRIEARVFRRG